MKQIISETEEMYKRVLELKRILERKEYTNGAQQEKLENELEILEKYVYIVEV